MSGTGERRGGDAPRLERPLGGRESQRWIATAEAAEPILGAAAMAAFIAGRESDFYALWASLPSGRYHALARVMHDHALVEGGPLRQAAATTLACDRRPIEVRERACRPARQARLDLRFGAALMRRPRTRHHAELPAAVGLNWTEAVEANPPAGQPPLTWLLLTSHPVTTSAQAWQIVAWHQQRWVIEQLFRVMKGQGLNIEESQVQSADRLEKPAAIAAKAAAIVMQLGHARNGEDRQEAHAVFSSSAIDTLAALENRFKSKTRFASNPHPKASLAWAAWIIARLGGRNGYASAKPPGPVTFYNGLRYFRACAEGWSLRDVYMP